MSFKHEVDLDLVTSDTEEAPPALAIHPLDLDLLATDTPIWMVRLPRYLASKWKDNVAHLAGRRLATVRVSKPLGKIQMEVDTGVLDAMERELEMTMERDTGVPTSGTTATGQKISVLTTETVIGSRKRKDTTHARDLPQMYDLNVLSNGPPNQFVFREQNTTEYSVETHAIEMPEMPELKFQTELEKRQEERMKIWRERSWRNPEQMEPLVGNRKYIPFVRTIPKHTRMEGTVVKDCQMIPSKSDRNYSNINKITRMSMPTTRLRPTVTLLDEIPGVTQANAGPLLRGTGNQSFLQSSRPAKDLNDRATRMDRPELLQVLFGLFEEYEYWSMRGLKERTHQPESYLKEVLESIAVLIKKGPYTSRYTLRKETKILWEQEKGEKQEEEADDDEEMEDVVG